MSSARPAQRARAHDANGNDAIEVRSLSKVYASQDGPVQALADLSFAIADAELVTIVGHSGCGKSTLLKIIAGLLPPSSGTVKVRGRTVDRAALRRRHGVSAPVLLKWRTILDNVMLPIEMLHLPRKEGAAARDRSVEIGGTDRLSSSLSRAAFRRHAAARCHLPRPGA